MSKTKEGKSVEQRMPALEINEIIKLIVDVSLGNETPEAAAKEYVKPYKEFAKVFARDKAEKMIESAMKNIGIEELSDQEFSDRLIDSSKRIVGHVRAFMAKEISEQQLIELIGGSGIKDVAMQVLSALGIHEKLGVKNPAEIMKLAPQVVAYNAAVAAYEELRKAQEDLTLAKERRKQIEAACLEAVSMIRLYRGEMEQTGSKYLTSHLGTFEAGCDAMDKALLDGDVNGYIKGNTEIQEILGRDIQFRNQEEFNDLMDSDDAFIL